MNSEARWPDFYVVGAPRCATTSLYQYLRQHPEIFLPDRKELNFFTRPSTDSTSPTTSAARTTPSTRDTATTEVDHDAAEAERYLAHFSDARPGQVVGEVSTGYLRDSAVPDRIHAKRPDARIIALLRDPVERAHSNYLSQKRKGRFQDPMARLVDAELDAHAAGQPSPYHLIDDGRYAPKLERCFATFGRPQVLVLLFDELKANPQRVLRDVAAFLSVDPAPFTRVDTSAHNFPSRPRNTLTRWMLHSKSLSKAAGALLPLSVRTRIGNRLLLRRVPKQRLDPELGRRLVAVYGPEVDALERLLGRALPELRRTWDRYAAPPQARSAPAPMTERA